MSMRSGWVTCLCKRQNLSNADSARSTFAGESLLKKQIRDSETLRKKFETLRPKETSEKRDFVTRLKSLRDFEIRSKISDIHDFLGTIRHPYICKYWSSVLQTWHNKCASKKKQNDTLRAAAIATILAPVSFCQKLNIPTCICTFKVRQRVLLRTDIVPILSTLHY